MDQQKTIINTSHNVQLPTNKLRDAHDRFESATRYIISFLDGREVDLEELELARYDASQAFKEFEAELASIQKALPRLSKKQLRKR